MDLYLKWILSQQQWLYGLDSRSRHRPCCDSLTVARQATICVDANQGIPGDIVERHRGDASDFNLLCLSLSEEAKGGQTCAGRQHNRQLDESPAIPVTVRRFDPFPLLVSPLPAIFVRQTITAKQVPGKLACLVKTQGSMPGA